MAVASARPYAFPFASCSRDNHGSTSLQNGSGRGGNGQDNKMLHSTSATNLNKLQQVQNSAARIVTGS